MESPDFADRSTWPVEASEPWTAMTRCDDDDGTEMWENDRYWVTVKRGLQGPFGQMVRLGIQSIDQRARHDWREFQRIKNDVLGPEWEALELYPAESRLIDPSNYYLLWCFPKRVPLGIHAPRTVIDADKSPAPQRAFAATTRA